eukprot:SAG11_NODE_1323_length_5200_cov_7.642423_1_plen_182_part_00
MARCNVIGTAMIPSSAVSRSVADLQDDEAMHVRVFIAFRRSFSSPSTSSTSQEHGPWEPAAARVDCPTAADAGKDARWLLRRRRAASHGGGERAERTERRCLERGGVRSGRCAPPCGLRDGTLAKALRHGVYAQWREAEARSHGCIITWRAAGPRSLGAWSCSRAAGSDKGPRHQSFFLRY